MNIYPYYPELIWPIEHAIGYCIGVSLVAIAFAWLMDCFVRRSSGSPVTPVTRDRFVTSQDSHGAE